jgi:hypothetical protein
MRRRERQVAMNNIESFKKWYHEWHQFKSRNQEEKIKQEVSFKNENNRFEKKFKKVLDFVTTVFEF